MNLSSKPLDDAVYSALQKGLNYAVALTVLPIEDILTGVETAEEDTQETVRDSSRSRDNLTGAERKALRALSKNTDLTILPADKGNATVVLNTVEYNRKIGALLEDPAYRVLARDSTEAVVHKTILLLKKFSLAEEVCKRLHPTGSIPPRLYGLPKIHKEGVPLRPIVSNIGAPTYQLAKFLAGVLSPLVGHSIHHVKNSTEFVHTLSPLRVDWRT
jgi:hypothetical protein